MTTIAYRDGKIAADGLVTGGNHRDGEIIKVSARNGVLCGAAGICSEMTAFLKWFDSGQTDEMPKLTDVAAFIARKDGVIDFFDQTGNFSFTPTSEYYAVGSGCEYAYGAMAMGATAEEAVAIAIKFDVKSGGKITTLSR